MARSSVVIKNKTPDRKSVKKAVLCASNKSNKKADRKKTVVKSPAKKSTKTKLVPTLLSNLTKSISPTLTIKRNPLGHLLLEKILRETGFRGGISTDKKLLDAYSTDESIFSIRPQIVIQPKNRHDVEIAVKVVADETKRFESLSLTPRAAGTGLGGGSLTDSVVIDVSAHLNKFGDIVAKKDKITFTTEPGASWRTVEKNLKAHKAYLPPYPASKDICSIGGSVANNAAGPDSLRYGHCADWVESMDVVLNDGCTYTIKALDYREFKLLVKQDHEHARIAREIFELIRKNEREIKKNHPQTKKNTAGYPLWSVLPEGVTKFKKGIGKFDLTRLISGGQGTVGIITNLTMRSLPVAKNTTLLAIPIFDLEQASVVIEKILVYNPINVEIFDALTFDLAMRNPNFFKERLEKSQFYQVLFTMYATYHVRFKRKLPEFIVLATLDQETTENTSPELITEDVSTPKIKARVVKNKAEAEMYWQIRRASYSLSKLQDTSKRPAAFLEDMVVPPKKLSEFFTRIKALLKEFNITAAIHGHGGDGHFHFYPLLDFSNKTTPALITKMSEEFFSTAIKFGGNICGEHNDGIIRTPHLNKMFSRKMIDIFEQTEAIFDPNDIFNPGKKVNPRFNVKDNIRTTN